MLSAIRHRLVVKRLSKVAMQEGKLEKIGEMKNGLGGGDFPF